MRLATLALAAFCLSLTSALAATEGTPAASAAFHTPQQILLTETQVQNVIAALPAVKALAEKNRADWKKGSPAQYKADFGAKITQVLKAHGALEEFTGLVAQNGFASANDWWAALYSVLVAVRAAEPDEGAAHQAARVAASMAAVKNNPNLSAAQKAKIEAQMRNAEARVAAMQPPPANVALVTPYKDKIHAAMDGEAAPADAPKAAAE